MGEDARASLEGVLDVYGVVYAAGRVTQMVSCPLHEDNTPSMSIHFGKGLWKCHSCGKGGDAYTLVELKEGVDYTGACEFIHEHGIECEDGEPAPPPSQGAYGHRRTPAARGKKGGPRYRPRYSRGAD